MRLLETALLALMVALPATAGDTVICIGGDETKGREHATAGGGKWTKENLPKAFGWAAEALAGKEASVVIKVAAGDYVGEQALPAFNSPKGKLEISGGWDPTFTTRDPFRTPTRFLAASARGGPMLLFAAKDQLGGIHFDGVLWDVAESNKYDEKSNSLLKGTSSTHWVIRFNNVATDSVLIENCVFMNSPHRVTETLIMTLSDKAEIKLYNTVFYNCVIPIKLDSCRQKVIPAKITVDHCSFICNWAFNPDPDTSNPAALECAGKYAANEIVITNNLFYANFGGAIMNIEVAKTKVTVANNNFVGNGLLHGDPDPAAAAMLVGRKQPIPVGKVVDAEEDPTLAGNCSVPPGLPVTLGDPKSIDANDVKENKGWENEARRLLGKPLQGGKVEIKDYAPRRTWDPANLPFPTEDGAKRYGASPDLVDK